MIAALVGLCVPVVAARLVLRAVGPGVVHRSALLAWALACCLGLGVASTVTFVALNAGVYLSPAYAAGDLAIWLAVGGVSWWYGSRLSADGAGPTRAAAVSRPALDLWAARGLFLVVAGLSLSGPVVEYLASPHGQWDAWAIWNQKARFMVRAGPGWTASFDIPWSNPSHPLFVALSVARLWAYAGAELTAVPAMLSGVYGVTTAAVVIGAVGAARVRAWLAGAVLMAPSSFAHLVAAQTADLPVGLLLVASLAPLAIRTNRFWSGRVDVRGTLLLSGACAGLAAWTKNEGLVFLPVAAMLVLWTAFRYGRIRDAGWWFLGTAPFLLLLAWLKGFLAVAAPQYAEGVTLGTLVEQVLSTERHVQIWRAMWPHAVVWGGAMARGAWPFALLVLAAHACTRAGRVSRSVLAVVAFMCTGYYAVYVLTNLELSWLVATTFERLTLQLWPSVVLALFLIGTPDTNGAGRDEVE
jgi:hypothetical protein